MKKVWGERLTTVFPRQGHYAHDASVANFPRPDVTDRADRRSAGLRFGPPAPGGAGQVEAGTLNRDCPRDISVGAFVGSRGRPG